MKFHIESGRTMQGLHAGQVEDVQYVPGTGNSMPQTGRFQCIAASVVALFPDVDITALLTLGRTKEVLSVFFS